MNSINSPIRPSIIRETIRHLGDCSEDVNGGVGGSESRVYVFVVETMLQSHPSYMSAPQRLIVKPSLNGMFLT